MAQACVKNWPVLFYYKFEQKLSQIGASIVINWSSCYKLEQPLLQNRAAITNCGKMYYQLGQVLEIKAIITNWGITLLWWLMNSVTIRTLLSD